MRIATFNVQNMRLRSVGDAPALDGAWDADVARRQSGPEIDILDRRLTAEVIGTADADVVALQEVFDQDTLDYFHNAFLIPAGCAPYPHRVCLPGNDGRGLNVALLSRPAIDRVQSHATLTPHDLGLDDVADRLGKGPVFRRDCLEADIGGITFFVCHFKAPYPDREMAWEVRHAEARAVRALIERRFGTPRAANWIVLGDLNEPRREETPHGSALAPLMENFAVNVMNRLGSADGWTLHVPDSEIYTRPDAILLSPALAAAHPGLCPVVVRSGMDRNAERYSGPRLPEVGTYRPHASDHALAYIDLAEPGATRA